jgi:formylglycine-generating enzyme required for sulfatase activity
MMADHRSRALQLIRLLAVLAFPVLLAAGEAAGDVPAPALPAAVLPAPPHPKWAAATGTDHAGSWADLVAAGITQRLRWIPPGTFTMGDPHAERDEAVRTGASPELVADEVPHQVTLSAGFWLADSPCTQALWLGVMGANPAHFTGDLQRPVESVSWADVQRFMVALNGVVAGGTFGLPTEAQREYACRAGTLGPFAGPSIDELGWYLDNSEHATHAVKGKSANAWGLFDMHGNVAEACADWYDDYPARAVSDPVGPAAGAERVYRGGCWATEAWVCRSAHRLSFDPEMRADSIGFRLAAPGPAPVPAP